MKILHTIEGLGAKFGGIATCTYDLLNAMQNPIDSVRILSPDLRDKNDTNLGTDAKWAMTYSNDGIGPFNYSPNLKKSYIPQNMTFIMQTGCGNTLYMKRANVRVLNSNLTSLHLMECFTQKPCAEVIGRNGRC